MRESRRLSSATERGFALVSALVLAFLFFALIGLILIESTLSLRIAHQYRAKIVANNLAESAVQLALQELAIDEDGELEVDTAEGKISTTCRLTPSASQGGYDFEIAAVGVSAGVTRSRSRIIARGHQSVGTVIVREVEHVE